MSGVPRSADEVDFFRDPATGVDVEKQLDELSDRQQEDLARIVRRLSMYPELRTDVRAGGRGPVLAITYTGTLWVFYWVDTRPRGTAAAPWICVKILVLVILDEPSNTVPESAFQLAVERYARDIEVGARM